MPKARAKLLAKVGDVVEKGQPLAADLVRGSGVPVGPLHGVPITFKDNINTKMLRTTAGTVALADHRPRHNAPVVERLLRAGAIALAKNNMHELSFGITSNNATFGPVHNPCDLTMIPGGSGKLVWRDRSAPHHRALAAGRNRADFLHPRHAGATGARHCRSGCP